jgi:hypothetical protein
VNATAWKELEVLQDGAKPFLPNRRINGFNGRERTGKPNPRISDRLLLRLSARIPILCLPNVSGNVGCNIGHSFIPEQA